MESLARVAGRFQRADEIRRLPLPAGQGRGPIYLEDVATINDGIEEQRVFVSLNGLPAVKVTIQKQPDANSIAVVEGIKAKLEDLREAGLVTEDMTLQVLLDE